MKLSIFSPKQIPPAQPQGASALARPLPAKPLGAAPQAQKGSRPNSATKVPQVAGKGLQTLQKGMTSVADLIAPSSVEVDYRYIRIGERFYTTFFIVGYPRFVSPNWLEPIVDYDHTMDIAMFCYPTSSSDVLVDLRRKIAEMEATISSDTKNGHPVDPKIEASLQDALSLQEELAKGIERFFQFSFYITLSSESSAELQDATKQLQTELASLLLIGKTATLQMEEGFKTTMPIAQDKLFITRNMDTTSLASTFPFTSAIMTQNKGVLYGMNQQNGSLIIFDRFSLENANEIVFGKSGAGKSFLIKLEIMRQFMMGTEVIVIDPEGEYGTLTKTLGGEHVEFSSNSPVKINPFDLSQVYEEGENELGLKIMSLHALLQLIMGELDPAHDAALDTALIESYRQKGITPDPATQKNKPPLMEDLYKTLLGMENTVAKEMAFRLEKFIKGSAAGIFNEHTNFDLNNPLTVFNIKNLEEELRPVAMHIILDYVWTKVKRSLKRRLLILDEAWYMMKFEDSASFVYSIAKRARKYYLGLTTATQDVEDFLKTDYGKAVLTNSSLQILLKQGTAEVDLVGETFYLSEGERELLLAADVGEGLFFAGRNHVAMKVLAAPFEYQLITSNPEELLKKQQKAQQRAAEAAPQIARPVQQATPPAVNPMINQARPSTPQQAAPVAQTPPVVTPQPTIQTPPPAQPTLGQNPTSPLNPTPGAPGVAIYANGKAQVTQPTPPAASAGAIKNPYASPIP
jgi:conjugal transfer ATP-binding protein TraC